MTQAAAAALALALCGGLGLLAGFASWLVNGDDWQDSVEVGLWVAAIWFGLYTLVVVCGWLQAWNA